MKRKAAPVPQTQLGRLARQQPAAGPALLSAANARRLAERLARLRGAAMRLGQLMSLPGDDVLPPEFSQALARAR